MSARSNDRSGELVWRDTQRKFASSIERPDGVVITFRGALKPRAASVVWTRPPWYVRLIRTFTRRFK